MGGEGRGEESKVVAAAPSLFWGLGRGRGGLEARTGVS